MHRLKAYCTVGRQHSRHPPLTWQARQVARAAAAVEAKVDVDRWVQDSQRSRQQWLEVGNSYTMYMRAPLPCCVLEQAAGVHARAPMPQLVSRIFSSSAGAPGQTHPPGCGGSNLHALCACRRVNLSPCLQSSALEALNLAVESFARPAFPCALIAGDVVILNLLDRLGYLQSGRVPIIFIDTFHLFQETHDFLHRLEARLEALLCIRSLQNRGHPCTLPSWSRGRQLVRHIAA